MKGTLRWFILAIVALWIVWIMSGGPNNAENRNAPFLDEPNPIGTGKPYTLQELKEQTRP